ncbi:MAG: type II secretion system protein GspG [Syntrophus sp. (in: bacteria)]|nr:type II secretion system protein GspG [Syntrophus sp. (in: bacteria)]
MKTVQSSTFNVQRSRILNSKLKTHNSKLTSRGFTLIELMIVIVIIGILATLLVPRIMDRPEEARRIKAKTDIKTIESALKLYKLDNGSYPTTEQGLQALIRKPDSQPVPRKWKEGGYLESTNVPNDPWSKPYYYTSPAQDGKDYEIISYGSDGEPGGTGKNADISSKDIEKD